jgi:anti-sigma-K factor RskA
MSDKPPELPDRNDALAAEYVLGTLDPAERASIAARRRREPALDVAITAWEHRLGPLADLIPPVDAPQRAFGRIEERIDRLDRMPAMTAGSKVDVTLLQRRAGRWRRIAIAASALAASLVAVIYVRETQRPQVAPRTFVAVMQKDDASPSFLVTVDIETRMLTVRPVAATTLPDKSYQLWMAHSSFEGVRSLGLVSERDLTPRPVLAQFDRGVIENATFAVSLEPAGGSPINKPTGPVLFHAKLIQASQ